METIIDFTDLNKACPKDSFPLPHIDRLVKATAEHELLLFMDAFSGYNQILMNHEDQEKTSFITERGVLWYTWRLFLPGIVTENSPYPLVDVRLIVDSHGSPRLSSG